jgi:hypothetical protein
MFKFENRDLCFEFSDDDLANFILQRTDPFIALGGREPLNQWFNTGKKEQLVKFLDHQLIQKFLSNAISDIQKEFEWFAKTVDLSNVKKATSIGPGLSIFELFLSRQTQCHLYLIDIEYTEEHIHGFSPQGSGYSSNKTARRFLESNGISADRIQFCNPKAEKLNASPVDLIISNLSMGFHYPVDAYVSYIRSALKQKGLFVFDKRKSVPDAGWSEISGLFNGKIAVDCGKHFKLVAERR